ncbi:hypothetical protein [Synechococcus sp. CBW1107]|uniref:hypothetical protein n=1 Tax=Synechococcus sp. CBW1107 TaxID=2789857 RepID=UPI002AD574E0|nr:hypothetical protein [Synechococcus sp. CBW1107]
MSLAHGHSYGKGHTPQPQPTDRDARMRRLVVFTDPDESKMLDAKCLQAFHRPRGRPSRSPASFIQPELAKQPACKLYGNLPVN